MRRLLSLALVGPLLLAACAVQPTDGDPSGADARRLPEGQPSIVGVVTTRVGDRVRVEENPADSSGSAKALVRLSPDARLLRPDGSAAFPADVAPGRRVRIWYEGPVAESYPVQATAGVVVVEE